MKIKPKYDGCTFSKDFNFTDCCNDHDDKYIFSIGKRVDADREFRECIKRHGHPVISWIYWLAVRVFGIITWLKYKRRNRT